MKTIYKSFIAFAASLLLVPVAHAQRDIPYVDKGGFGYNKYVVNDNPNNKGEYTLRIETFVTGTVEQKEVAVPSDIILVLDASGSMNECYNIGMRVPEDLELAGTANVTYNAFDTEGVSTNGWRWIRFPYDTGDYYRIHRVRTKIGTDAANKPLYSYYYYFDVESGGTSTRYYLNLPSGTASVTNPGFTTEMPDFHDETASTDAASKQQWKGKVYRYPYKVKVMREAVSDFIDEIARNNDQLKLEAGEVGNRIAVVRFATAYPTAKQSAAFQSDSLAELNVSTTTSVLKKFYEVSAKADSDGAANATSLKTAVNNMTISGNTSVDQGFNLARLLMKDADADYPAVENGVTKRNRVVVLFTDGEPNGTGNFAGAVKRTIDLSNYLKASSEDAAEGAQAYDTKVFTIGVWPSATEDRKLKWDLYMGHVSSNYPIAYYKKTAGLTKVTDWLDDQYPPLPAEECIYYMDSSQPDFDLKKVFMAIAKSVGGENKGVGESTIMMDKISDSFALPADIDASKIKVYTAQCLGELNETYQDSTGADKHYLAFAERVEVSSTARTLDSLWVNEAKPDASGKQPYSQGWVPTFKWEKKLNYSVDGNISVDFNTTSQQVTVTGFNYADLWCGHDPAHQSAELYDSTDPNYGYYQQGFRGFKLILEFPIVSKDGALGGPNVPTNKPESGLYLPNSQGAPTTELLRYQEPALPIPVNLWIEKQGLRPNESATINIYRKLVAKPEGSTVEPEYNFFQRVNFIGKEDGSPVLEKLLNLDPRYYYKIWEEGWSWSYTNQAADFESAPSTETVTTNPIVIKNDYDDPDVKHAEAAKRNKMEKTGGN